MLNGNLVKIALNAINISIEIECDCLKTDDY